MRVVVVGGWAPSLVNFRGPLLDEMVRRGHDVVAMAADATPAVVDELQRRGVRFQAWNVERAGVGIVADLRAMTALTRALRELSADVVVAYTIKPVVYGMLAAWLAGVPRRAALITGLGYSFAARSTRKQAFVAQISRALYRAALPKADVVFFQNADDRDEMKRLKLLSASSRVEVVRGSGVDTSAFPAAPLPEGPPRFVFLGRLLRDKGIYELVEAARIVRARHPAVTFQVAGWLDPNPESVSRDQLEAWTRDGIFEYLGTVADVRPALAESHALILPSYREGTPRSVLEAMSTGRAVVTTDAPGCRDTVDHGRTGLLVPVRDSAKLADAILRLTEDPTLLVSMGAAARARAELLYDARQIASQMCEILHL